MRLGQLGHSNDRKDKCVSYTCNTYDIPGTELGVLHTSQFKSWMLTLNLKALLALEACVSDNSDTRMIARTNVCHTCII